MLLIAHRGNTNGPNPKRENHPDFIREALSKGYHVEIDVWLKSDRSLFLGHDEPQYQTTLDFLQHDKKIICHAKTVTTFHYLVSHGLHCFFHDKDPATLTSQNKLWLYPGVPPPSLFTGVAINPISILVMPEWPSINYHGENWLDYIVRISPLCYGVCSDYVDKIRQSL